MVNRNKLDLQLMDLQQWFEENPKLPAKIDRQLLRRFLKCMHSDVEETKKLILLNYMLRNKNPHIFLERDPEDDSTKQTLETSDMVPLPGLTPEGCKLMFYRLTDFDPRKMSNLEELKVCFMTSDCHFTMHDVEPKIEDNNDDMAEGEIQIIDIAGYTMSHVARISIMALRTQMKFLQEAYPVRLRALHMLNCPSFLDRMITLLKPFVHEEVFKMIHFHSNDYESLYKHVPRDMLPEEYGGKAGKLTDLKRMWRQILLEKRDYLMDSKYWRIEKEQRRERWTWW